MHAIHHSAAGRAAQPAERKLQQVLSHPYCGRPTAPTPTTPGAPALARLPPTETAAPRRRRPSPGGKNKSATSRPCRVSSVSRGKPRLAYFYSSAAFVRVLQPFWTICIGRGSRCIPATNPYGLPHRRTDSHIRCSVIGEDRIALLVCRTRSLQPASSSLTNRRY